MISENDVAFIKRYIKAYLTPTVYDLCKKFNSNNDQFRFVVSGGDAIAYYVNSVEVLSKDFDIKIVYKDFDDWKAYNENEPFSVIESFLPTLKARRAEFLREFEQQVFTEKDRMGQTKFALAVGAACAIINDANKNVRIDSFTDLDFELTKAAYFGLIVNDASKLKPDEQAAWRWSFKQKNEGGDTGRISYVYKFQLQVTDAFDSKKKVKTLNISEGLIDCNCWTPAVYAYQRIYRKRMYQPLISFLNPHKEVYELLVDQDEFQQYQSTFVFRNFSYVNIENLCIISISYLLWDTVRMANVTYNVLLNGPTKQQDVLYHAKYAHKYWNLITALFSKLRCVKPFTDAMERCANDPIKNNLDANLKQSLEQLESEYTKEYSYRNPDIVMDFTQSDDDDDDEFSDVSDDDDDDEE
jgi:hypothetical protein